MSSITLEEAADRLHRTGASLFVKSIQLLDIRLHCDAAALAAANAFRCISDLADRVALDRRRLLDGLCSRNVLRACDRINGNYLRPYRGHVGCLAIAKCSIFQLAAAEHPSDVVCRQLSLIAVARVLVTSTS